VLVKARGGLTASEQIALQPAVQNSPAIVERAQMTATYDAGEQ
jgi:hypothetical protein